MNERFTDEQVMSTLRAVVAERPDYVYEIPEVIIDGETEAAACFYVRDCAPSCLIGHVMHRLGLPLDVLSEHEGSSPGNLIPVLGISERAADVLDRAQARQDEGQEWRRALDAAEGVWEG